MERKDAVNVKGIIRKDNNVREQVDVDMNCQIMDARNGNKAISGLYGIGQGYSLGCGDHFVQAETRPGAKADSVGLYIR